MNTIIQKIDFCKKTPLNLNRKESQIPLLTKAYSVGFNHNAELSHKKWSQKINPFWR